MYELLQLFQTKSIKISGCFKVHHTIHPNPPQYSRAILFILRNLDFTILKLKTETNKSKLEVVLVIRGKERELTNEGKRKRDERCKEEKRRERK